jgi:hypothetical protein
MGWLEDERVDREIVVPANSRVFVPYFENTDRDLQFFAKKRSVEKYVLGHVKIC